MLSDQISVYENNDDNDPVFLRGIDFPLSEITHFNVAWDPDVAGTAELSIAAVIDGETTVLNTVDGNTSGLVPCGLSNLPMCGALRIWISTTTGQTGVVAVVRVVGR